jgi:hypothetical protein
VRLQEEKFAAEEKKKLNARRLLMIREDELSAKAEAKCVHAHACAECVGTAVPL